MHGHNHHHAIRDYVVNLETHVDTVYVTASKTFDGPVGGYLTGSPPGHSVGPPMVHEPAPSPSSSHTYHAPHRNHRPHNLNPTTVPYSYSYGLHRHHSSSTSTSRSVGTPVHHSSKTHSSGSSESTDRPHPYPYNLNRHHSSGNSSSSDDGGMTGGARAGLAIGLIALILLIGGVVFFFYRRKQNANSRHQPLDDEKSGLNRSQSTASRFSLGRSKTNAPRLSLRPVTQMFPPMSEKQENVNASTMIANSAASARNKPGNNDTANPFGDHAEANGAPVVPPVAAVPKPLTVKSDRNGDRSPPSNAKPFPVADAGARPRSPTGNAPNNVHRVQLDFNPSMDDELGLRAGQLVRMLHEYDDGWALCIRLDRSQQGVVPRTCLSKLPVKPRHHGQASGMRPSQQAQPEAPVNPPTNPQLNPVAGSIRARSQSNDPIATVGPFGSGEYEAEQSRPRANSDASAQRVTPESGSLASSPSSSPTQTKAVPARKPVPGQAL